MFTINWFEFDIDIAKNTEAVTDVEMTRGREEIGL